MAGREVTLTPTKRERRKSPAMGFGTDSSTAQQSAPPPPISPTSSVADITFEPTVDMMVNDFDDEATLNEEEALADLEAHNAEDEIATLREESEMPIEQLLAKYGSMTNMQPALATRPGSSSSSSGGFGAGCSGSSRRRRAAKRQLQEAEANTEELPQTSKAATASPLTPELQEPAEMQLDEMPEISQESTSSRRGHRSHLLDLYPGESFPSSQNPSMSAVEDLESFTPLQTLLDEVEDEEEEEEEEEESDTDSDDARKIIMVGPDYQAEIPEGLSQYGDILPYENEDQLIWAPSQVSERAVEDYLAKIQETRTLSTAAEEGEAAEPEEPSMAAAPAPAPTPAPPVASPATAALAVPLIGSDLDAVVKDNEQALHLLVQCGYDFKEALRRKRLNVLPLSDTMSSWSEEECQKFEEGIQKFGKDFYQIRQNQVRTRTMRELVQFYYLWKKSERRDQSFALNDTIDHMDVFINESGNGNGNGNGNGSCSSLGSSCSSSNGHSNGNAAMEHGMDKDAVTAAGAAAASVAIPPAAVTSVASPRKSTSKNYSIMTGGNAATGGSRKRGVSFVLEEDSLEQENGVESLG